MIEQVTASYLAFLLKEMQGDAKVIDNPWVYGPVFPFLLYAVYMGIKWYLLLAPLTLPITTFMVFREAAKTPKFWKN